MTSINSIDTDEVSVLIVTALRILRTASCLVLHLVAHLWNEMGNNGNAARKKFNVSRAVWASMLPPSRRTVEKWGPGGSGKSAGRNL
jgi:hypothetical protein